MDTFDKREEGFERAFSHAQELQFRARVRRNRLLGLWAGETQGLSGPALEDYAAGLSHSAVEGGDDAALIADLSAKLGLSTHRIRRRMDEFGAQAVREIQAGR